MPVPAVKKSTAARKRPAVGTRPAEAGGAAESLPVANAQAETSIELFLANVERRALRMAQAMLQPDREQAQDVVQDSMMKMVEHYAHKPAAEWPALFFTILNNRINDVWRRRLVQNSKHRIVSLSGGISGESTSDRDGGADMEIAADSRADGVTEQEASVTGLQLRHIIERALSELPWSQRQVFTLREWQGLSIHETAQVLGCTENVVKQHHFRAMQSLRKKLAEVWDHV